MFSLRTNAKTEAMKTPSFEQSSNPLLRKAGRLTLAVAVAAALAACGGGGGGGDAAPVQNTQETTQNENANPNPNPNNDNTNNPPPATTIAALPVGYGIASFSWAGVGVGEFVHVDGATGAVTKMSTPCHTNDQGFSSLDTRPDGVVVGAASDLYLVDMVSGDCEKLATPPVPLGAVAVAADGKIHGISLSRNSSGQFELHVLDAAGTGLSSVALSGADLGFVKGIDFTPEGKLYMSAYDDTTGYHVYEVDTATGQLTIKFDTTLLAGDIDIDSSGKLRSSGTNQTVYTLDISNGAVLGTLPTDRLTERLMVYR